MKTWVQNLIEELKDVIEIEVALHLSIAERDFHSHKKYQNISKFFDSLISEYELEIKDKETLHRYYKTTNIHTMLRVRLKPKENWMEEKVLNPDSLKTIFALRLTDTRLTKGRVIKKLDIVELNKTYKRINANNEKIVKSMDKDAKEIKLTNKLIPYSDLLDLYNFFMNEIEYYENEFISLKSILQLELDFSFVLHNELLRLTHILKKKSKDITAVELEFLIGEIAMKLANIEFPWIRLKLLRGIIDNLNEYSDIMSIESDIKELIDLTIDTINTWVEFAVDEEKALKFLSIKHYTYIEFIKNNYYKRKNLYAYYNLFKKEFKLRWLYKRDFNDQDRNRFHRAIKDKPLKLIGYN